MRPSAIYSMSRATAVEALKKNDNRKKRRSLIAMERRRVPLKQCADKHLGTKFRKRGTRFISPSVVPIVSVRVPHIILILCSRSISASLLQWRNSDDASSSLVKADNPFRSNHVAAWYRSTLNAEHYCRKHHLSTASLLRSARHLLSAEDLRKRTEDLQKSRRKKPERQPKNARPNRPKRPPPAWSSAGGSTSA